MGRVVGRPSGLVGRAGGGGVVASSSRVVLAFACALAACGGPTPEEDLGELLPATTECLTGVWSWEPPTECFQCSVWPSAECDESDCTEIEVVQYDEEGRHITLVARRSASLGTTTAVSGCPYRLSTWRIDEVGVLQLFNAEGELGRTLNTLCNEHRFGFDFDAAPWRKPTPGLERFVRSLGERTDCESIASDL